MSGTFQLNSAVLPDSTRPAAGSLSVDLRAVTPGVGPVAAAAARLAGDLAAVFGVADLDVLSAEGLLRPRSFPPGRGRPARLGAAKARPRTTVRLTLGKCRLRFRVGLGVRARAGQALASWNLATKSADTRPRWLTSMPCDSAHARTVFAS
jgi:hypothetical protein